LNEMTLIGTAQEDLIVGGPGSQTIIGGNDDDTLVGGSGDDTYVFNSGDVDFLEEVVELPNGGTDTFLVQTSTNFDNMTDASLDEIEQVLITTGQTANFDGDQLSGEAIAINETSNTGTTTLDINLDGLSTVDFSTLTFAAFTGGDAFDNGADQVNIEGDGSSENITGTTIADNIDGNGSNDTIHGNGGNDTIEGDTGVDSMWGDAGADTFLFAAGDTDGTPAAATDVINDFSGSAGDRIDGSWGAGSGVNYLEAGATVADLATLLTAANTALDGTVDYYLGQVTGGNAYLVTDSDGTGYTEVIELVGVTLGTFQDTYIV